MDDFYDLIDGNNKIKYDSLVNFISNNPMSEFFKASKHPYLVGKELYDGEMKRKVGVSNTSTMMFKPAELRSIIDNVNDMPTSRNISGSGISKSLYVLQKASDSYKTAPNEISIGRSSFNDITIADYVISKKQALITIFFDKYFITDLNSTNGTMVDGEYITPGEKLEIKKNCVISFGRYSFVFTHSMELFARVKNSK